MTRGTTEDDRRDDRGLAGLLNNAGMVKPGPLGFPDPHYGPRLSTVPISWPIWNIAEQARSFAHELADGTPSLSAAEPGRYRDATR
jgi:hypothetical protein